MRKNYLTSNEINTIYFGGGTPSILSKTELKQIFDQISNFYLVNSPEITLEANPEDLNFDRIEEYLDVGINRLSIGVQTFNSEYLRFFNRSHTADQSKSAVKMAQRAGFDNISVDLIFGIPGQSIENFKKDLDQILALNTTHISIYGLTIEERTVFGNRYAKGRLTPLDEDLAAIQFEVIMDELEKAGYEHYEISNFCIPGYYSRHNTSYWKQEEYIGIGPAAHSYNKIARQYNVAHNMKYIRAIDSKSDYFESEILSPTQKINEYILTRIRTNIGIDLNELKEEFQCDLYSLKDREIQFLLRDNFMDKHDHQLCLTKKGKLVADSITERLVLE